jgi:DNA-binding transcriptional MerR regulator
MSPANKSPLEHGEFSRKEVLGIFSELGLTSMRLQKWKENGYFVPSHYKVGEEIVEAEKYQPPSVIPGKRPKDSPWYYSFEKLIELQIFLRLRNMGITPRRIKEAFDNYLRGFPHRRLTEMKIFTRNKKVYVVLDRQRMLDLFVNQVVSLDILLDEAERYELLGRAKATVKELRQTTTPEDLRNVKSS